MSEGSSGQARATAATMGTCAALLLALALLHVAGYALTTVVTDTARDVGEAWRIAHAGAWPLRGPQIGQRWTLGPAWFYLLAPIVAFAHSITAVALGVGALAALKLPLAWRLGRALVDARFGFVLAFVVALPGWASLEHVVFAHTNLAGTATLGFGLAALAAWRRPHPLRCALAGFALALAMHAHPAALVLAPFALAGAFAPPRRAGAGLARLAALGAGFALPFVPVFVAEAREGWPMLARSAEYVAGFDAAARLARIPDVVAGAWLAPFVLVRDFLLPAHGLARGAWLAFSFALAGIALAGLAQAARRRVALPWGVLAAAVLATALVALLREAIAFYFLLPLLPLVALALAFALDQALPRHRGALALSLGACALAANLAVLSHRAALARDGEQWLPRASLGDVARMPVADPLPLDYLPVFDLDRRVVPALCGRDAPRALHGDLATQLALAQGWPLVLACAPGTTLPQLGGEATPQLASVPVGLLRRAGLPVAAGAYGRAALAGVRPIHPRAGTPLAPSASYPPHPFELALDERAVVEARADAGDWLAITELDPALVASAEPVVEANGARIAPLARSAQTRLYRCAGCSGPVAWRVALETGDLDALDVFLFAAPLD